MNYFLVENPLFTLVLLLNKEAILECTPKGHVYEEPLYINSMCVCEQTRLHDFVSL